MSALFIILVSLTMALFSEKVLFSNRCISGLMSNLIKKSWTDFNAEDEINEGVLRFFVWKLRGGVAELNISTWIGAWKYKIWEHNEQDPWWFRYLDESTIVGKVCTTTMYNVHTTYLSGLVCTMRNSAVLLMYSSAVCTVRVLCWGTLLSGKCWCTLSEVWIKYLISIFF